MDTVAKKKLIVKLTESIETNADEKFDIKYVFGAWEDNRTSNDIINKIKSLRVE